MKKYGCFVGKFLPPHIGHLSVIDKALQECEKVLIVLAEAPEKSKAICKQDNFPYFPPSKRLEWLKKHYKNYSNIKFVFFDESPVQPFDMKKWSQEFKRMIKENITAKYGDESYRTLNELYFPECEFVPIDRDKINIHGTDIRRNKNLIKYMVKEGQEDVLNKIKGENENE